MRLRRGLSSLGPLTSLSLLLSLALFGSSATGLAAAATLSGELPEVLARAADGELIPVSIVLRDQLTGTRLTAQIAPGADPAARRSAVTKALQQHADRQQARLRQLLHQLEQRGLAARIRPLWIGNLIGADLTRAEIERIATFAEVERINWNPKRDVFLGDRSTAAAPALRTATQRLVDRYSRLAPAEIGLDEVECGVQQMQAPRVWNELGNTGNGAVIAVIDTGVCWTHTDIANQMWVNPGEDIDHDGAVMDPSDVNGVDDDGNGFVDDLIGWDFDNADREPNDDNSHGSHCAGTIAGDGTAGTQAGMAPDAKIMAVKVGVSFADEVDVWNAMQYAAANGANAISMSLGWPHGQNPDRATWRTNCENTIDAGTAMVIAAGNEGSGSEPDNVRTPGDVPRVITVGATDCADQITGFSSRGPVTWSGVAPFNDHPFPPGLIKPDISAPGDNTKSHDVCAGYSFKSGTSMATPHVAGAVALMFAANPGFTHDDVKQLLMDTAVDLGAPGMDNEYGMGRVDAYEAVLNSATPDGRINVRETITNCAGTINLTVSDSDLRGAGTVVVTLSSPTEPGGEPVTLTETGANSGSFKGTAALAGGAPVADGVLQVNAGELVTATYLDANDGHGGINVPKTDSIPVDCTAPVIGGVHATDQTLTSAVIRWTTDESSDSRVQYGPVPPPTSTSSSAAMGNDHAVTLTGLTSCTVYYYSAQSRDLPGNVAIDTNAGQYYHFETLGDFGEGPQSCHGGKVAIDGSFYACNTVLPFRVTDLDLNHNANVAETAVLEISSSTELTPELVVVTETGPNTSRFAGTITTTSNPVAADGQLSLHHGDLITVTYHDTDDGTGAAATSFDVATADCNGAVVSNLRVEAITDQRAWVRWTTSEPTDGVVDWGFSPALGNTLTDSGLSTDHNVLINRFDICNTIHVRVRGTDAFGNQMLADNHGAPFQFRGAQIPGLYYRQTFESGASGWTLPGEWQVGSPAGAGLSDPAAAYNNAGVLGHDLSGQGANPGNYEPNLAGISGQGQGARSPVLNATTWVNTKLMFQRKLSVEPNDDATLWVQTPQGRTIYRSAGTLVMDGDWTLHTTDLRQIVDGRPSVTFEFLQKSNGNDQRGGWTVDDFVLKNGALPDFSACGGCGSGPSFAGATGAFDNNACGATGVTVQWGQAVAWGSGGGGTYSVYRSTTPGFTPSPSNRIATGLAALSFNDAAAPAGTLYYLVRAENDETCSSGPANGGVTDTNTAHVSVQETTSRPIPGAVSGLNVILLGDAHVRLSWTAATNATGYTIYRSATGQPGTFGSIGTTTTTVFEDPNQGGNANPFFYLVRGTNPCGQEGP